MEVIYREAISKLLKTVTPAEAGVQKRLKILDSGFRRNDADGLLKLPPVKIHFHHRGRLF
jgi:hypothetical protein